MNLDLYCERLSDQFWAEPVNAATNIVFVLAGVWGLWKTSKNRNVWSFLLSLLSIAVGVGSFLFHTFANSKTHLLDLIPIFILTLLFVFFTFLKVLKMSVSKSFVSLGLFLALMVGIEILIPKSILNGSLLYAPALFTLAVISIVIKRQNLKLSELYKNAALLFLISLTFRTLDHQICDLVPLGTHFVWHLLNGVLLTVMIQITLEADWV